MPSIKSIAGYIERKGIYTLGRFVLGLTLAGVFVSGGAFSWAAGAGLFLGTAALQGFNTWRKQSYVEADLVNMYRDEIAATLGMNMEEVGKHQLHQVAYGDKSIGLEGNAVIRQDIEKSGRRMLFEIATTGAAVLTSIAAYLLFSPMLNPMLDGVAGMLSSSDTLNNLLPETMMPNSGQKLGIMVASGAGMGVFNNIYDKALGNVLGFNHKTATDLIRHIKKEVGRGRHISQEQVFGVYVAALPTLDETIKRSFGEHYQQLDEEQQFDAMKLFGQHYPIEQLTHDINHHVIQPDELAFVVVGQTSGVPRLNAEQMRQSQQESEKTVAEKVVESAKELLGDEPELENAPKTNFAQRVASERHDPALSHVERLLKEDSQQIDKMPTIH